MPSEECGAKVEFGVLEEDLTYSVDLEGPQGEDHSGEPVNAYLAQLAEESAGGEA